MGRSGEVLGRLDVWRRLFLRRGGVGAERVCACVVGGVYLSDLSRGFVWGAPGLRRARFRPGGSVLPLLFCACTCNVFAVASRAREHNNKHHVVFRPIH